MKIKYPLTEEQIEFIKTNYPLKGSKYCAEHLKIPKAIAQHWARKRLNLPVIDAKTRSAIMRETMGVGNGVPVETFLNFNSKESVYLLGLIWADGNINKNKVSMVTVLEDAEEYMTTFMKTGEWRFFDAQYSRYGVLSRKSRTIYTGNTVLAAAMKDLGYAAKSTGSACDVLNKIPDHLRHYWFRGLIDGDGYLSYSKRGSFWLKITSSYDQNWAYMEKACQGLDIEYKILRDRWITKEGKTHSRSVFSINSAKGVSAICNYIYKGRVDDNIGLSRKYNKWLEIKRFGFMRPNVGEFFED